MSFKQCDWIWKHHLTCPGTTNGDIELEKAMGNKLAGMGKPVTSTKISFYARVSIVILAMGCLVIVIYGKKKQKKTISCGQRFFHERCFKDPFSWKEASQEHTLGGSCLEI